MFCWPTSKEKERKKEKRKKERERNEERSVKCKKKIKKESDGAKKGGRAVLTFKCDLSEALLPPPTPESIRLKILHSSEGEVSKLSSLSVNTVRNLDVTKINNDNNNNTNKNNNSKEKNRGCETDLIMEEPGDMHFKSLWGKDIQEWDTKGFEKRRPSILLCRNDPSLWPSVPLQETTNIATTAVATSIKSPTQQKSHNNSQTFSENLSLNSSNSKKSSNIKEGDKKKDRNEMGPVTTGRPENEKIEKGCVNVKGGLVMTNIREEGSSEEDKGIELIEPIEVDKIKRGPSSPSPPTSGVVSSNNSLTSDTQSNNEEEVEIVFVSENINNRKIQKLNEENSRLVKKVTALENANADSSKLIAKMQQALLEERKNSQEQIEEMWQKYTAMCIVVQSFDLKSREAKDKAERASITFLEKEQEIIEEKVNEIQNLRLEYSREKECFEEEKAILIRKHEEEISSLQSLYEKRIANLTKELRESYITSQTKQLRIQKEELDEANRMLEEFNKKPDDLRREIDSLNFVITRNMKEKRDLEMQNRLITQHLEEQSIELDKESKRGAVLTAKVEDLEAQIEIIRKEKSDHMLEVLNLKDENGRLNGEKNRLNLENEQLTYRIHENYEMTKSYSPDYKEDFRSSVLDPSFLERNTYEQTT